MFTVCNSSLAIIEQFEFLFQAKNRAKELQTGGTVFFVCSPDGMVVSGY